DSFGQYPALQNRLNHTRQAPLGCPDTPSQCNCPYVEGLELNYPARPSKAGALPLFRGMKSPITQLGMICDSETSSIALPVRLHFETDHPRLIEPCFPKMRCRPED